MAAILNVHYQDMKEEVLEQAKAVSTKDMIKILDRFTNSL